mmetsp:Transcript_11586/g.27323  ORF Transcript_11586/g.27323 Transcript_11586/m.27323 type:complete len:307 (+) Transcript_11586:64-984(+)
MPTSSLFPELLLVAFVLLLQVVTELFQRITLLLHDLLLRRDLGEPRAAAELRILLLELLHVRLQRVDLFFALTVALVGAGDLLRELIEFLQYALQIVLQHSLRLPQRLVLLLQLRCIRLRGRAHGLVLFEPLGGRLHLLLPGLLLFRQLGLLGLVGLIELLQLTPEIIVLLEEALPNLELGIHLLLHILDGSLKLLLELGVSLTFLLRKLLILLGKAVHLLLLLSAASLKLHLHGGNALNLGVIALPVRAEALKALLHRGLHLLLGPRVVDPLLQRLVEYADFLLVRDAGILNALADLLQLCLPLH